MVHEERRIRNALQTRHKLNAWSFETEEYNLVHPTLYTFQTPFQGLRMNVETLFRQTVLTLNLNNC